MNCIPYKQHNKFPEFSGCYIVRSQEKVLYVGQSKNIKKRWIAHHLVSALNQMFPDAVVEFIECDPSELVSREKQLIRELRPFMNNKSLWSIRVAVFGYNKVPDQPTA